MPNPHFAKVLLVTTIWKNRWKLSLYAFADDNDSNKAVGLPADAGTAWLRGSELRRTRILPFFIISMKFPSNVALCYFHQENFICKLRLAFC